MAPATLLRDPPVDAPVVAKSSWWRRVRDRIGVGDASADLQAVRLERLHTLLVNSRTQLETGWIQGGWWSVACSSSATGERLVPSGFDAATTPPEQVRGACLVGALVLAGGRHVTGAHSEVAAAVEVVHDALGESVARSAATPVLGLPLLSAPAVRLARVQTLTRWNDRPERTKAEVLDIVDRAIARTVQSIVALPATPGQPLG